MKHVDIPPYDRISFPRKPNYEVSGDFFMSRHATAALDKNCRRHEPGDNAGRSVQGQHYLALKELKKTEKDLHDKNVYFQRERERLKRQWNELERKEVALRRNFKQFDQFVKENSEKRERAIAKTADQRKLWFDRTQQIDTMVASYESMKATKIAMDKTIQEYMLYEKFLNEVVLAEENATCIHDIISRYETLLMAKNELDTLQHECLQQLENAKIRMQSKIFKFCDKIEGLRIKLTVLEKKYEKAVENSQKWENIHGSIKIDAMERVIQGIGIKQACLRMYLEICKRKRIAPKFVDHFEKQFVFIKNAIGEYESLNKMVEEQKESEKKISLKPHLSFGSSKS